MKRSRFSEEQIIDALKQVENGRGIPELVRELGITETTFYRWRRKYGGMEVSDARRLKELEEENRKLKRMVADQALDIVALKDIVSKKMVKPKAKRAAVRHAQEAHGLSERRASRLVGIGWSSLNYQARPDRDEELRERLQDLASKWRRIGSRGPEDRSVVVDAEDSDRRAGQLLGNGARVGFTERHAAAEPTCDVSAAR